MPSHTCKALKHGAVACATVQAATLTLLGLIIGFSFSMAVSRYDLRKTYKEAGPMRLAPNMSGPGWCSPRMQPGYVRG
jgi:hypothetical protein